MSIGQHGLHGNAAQFRVVVGSSLDAGHVRMETSVLDAVWYVSHTSLLKYFDSIYHSVYETFSV